MASCQTARWVANSAPYVKLTVNIASSTDTTATLEWTLQYISDYAASTSVAKAYTVKIGGSTVKSSTYNINGKTGTKTIASGTKSITKTTSAQSIAFSVSFAFNLTWSGVYGGTKSASDTITVPAKTSYKISYNANDGSGAPSAQTKWYDVDLKLSTTKPSRTGYTFKGWATSASSTTVSYAAGATYTKNAAITLYAVWSANTYTVTYNANGGSGAPSAQTKTYGTALTLSTTKPTRTGYTFKGWATSASSTTVSYAAGATYTKNAAITLYAVWQLSYVKPRITSFSVARCDANETADESGTYALVKFSWSTDVEVSSVTIKRKLSTDSSYTKSTSLSVSGTSGTVSKIIGGGELSTDSTYNIQVTVTDSSDSSGTTSTTSKTKSLPGVVIPIDVLAENKGIAFGKPAELSGYADFGWNAVMTNNLRICGRSPTGEIKPALQPQNEKGNTVLGYGNYEAASGSTNIYGHDVYIGISNIAKPDVFRPYLSRATGTLTFTIRTAGYVTNSGKDVTFLIPTAVPIIGSPTLTVASADGFVLRQGGNYTHGSGANGVYVSPDTYSASISQRVGIYITASFSDTTNVINNDSIGIYWNGTITFS